jgi:hypothetical protein
MIHAVFGRTALDNPNTHLPPQNQVDKMAIGGIKSDGAAVEFARCFLRLANLPNFLLDRLSRFEATLWRRASRILYALDTLDRRKPQERTRHSWLAPQHLTRGHPISAL